MGELVFDLHPILVWVGELQYSLSTCATEAEMSLG